MNTPHTGPPTFTADGEIARIRELRDDCVAMGHPVEELEDWATNEEIHQNWREAEASLKEAYRLTAHAQSPITALAEAAWTQPYLRDYHDFLKRLRPFLKRLKIMDISYRDPF